MIAWKKKMSTPLVALLGFACMGQALASNVQVDKTLSAGERFQVTSSTAKLQFDPSILAQLPTAGITFSGVAPGIFSSSTSAVTTTLSSFNYDDVSQQLLSLQILGGGNFNMPTAKTILFTKVGGPGTVSFTDFTIDVSRKVVSANAFGANGLSTGRRDLFTFSDYVGNTTFSGAGTYSFQANNLLLTTAGVDAIAQGLALSSSGRSVFSKLSSLGSMSGSMVVAEMTAPVPEPSTWALMGLGLVTTAWVTRRNQRRASAHQ
jgi:PEP-CTERM motif